MQRPELGLTAACRLDSVRDGDTAVVRMRVGDKIAIRLIDCWTPEKNEPGGKEAATYLRGLLTKADEDGELFLWLPPFMDRDRSTRLDLVEVLQQLSFDRVPGRLFIGSQDVSALMVEAGHARKDDPKRARSKDEYGRLT